MPFSLHPSGYCAYFVETNRRNLIAGEACEYCKRIAGHSIDCPDFKYDEVKGASSRPKLFDSSAVLWAKYPKKSFLTFTLPSLKGKTYQRDIDCPETGDLVLAGKFSKVLEAWAKRVKRAGGKLSYVWAAEAQLKRRAKFGGVGDIHYHLVSNQEIKNDANKVIDLDTLRWLQSLWCDHVGAQAKNCLHVDPLPDRIESIPAYLTKQMSRYMSKGSPERRILGRQYSATRDLTKFKPITINGFPEAELINSKVIVTRTGFETSVHYFNTREVLELYGADMLDQARYCVSRTGKAFTPESINQRALKRQYEEINRAQAGTLLGLSYST